MPINLFVDASRQYCPCVGTHLGRLDYVGLMKISRNLILRVGTQLHGLKYLSLSTALCMYVCRLGATPDPPSHHCFVEDHISTTILLICDDCITVVYCTIMYMYCSYNCCILQHTLDAELETVDTAKGIKQVMRVNQTTIIARMVAL